MPDFTERYKNPPLSFGDAKRIKSNFVYEQQKRRKKRRTLDFEENREKSYPLMQKHPPPKASTMLQNEVRKKLSEWKMQQEKKRKMELSRKKPPFIVGIVHHRVYSPKTIRVPVTSTIKKSTEEVNKNSNIKKSITEATKKRLLAKTTNITTQKTPENLIAKKSPTNNKIKSDINTRKSFAPPNHKFKPPAGLPEIILSVELPIEDNPSNGNDILACNKTETTTLQGSVHCNSDSITLKVSFNKSGSFNLSQEEGINLKEKSSLDDGKITSPTLELVKRSLSREVISIDEEEKKMADIQDSKKDSHNKFEKTSNIIHPDRFVEIYSDNIATSTPILNNVNFNFLNTFNSSRKGNQQISRKDYSIEKLEKLRDKSVIIQSACQNDSNDAILRKSFDEKLKIAKNF